MRNKAIYEMTWILLTFLSFTSGTDYWNISVSSEQPWTPKSNDRVRSDDITNVSESTTDSAPGEATESTNTEDFNVYDEFDFYYDSYYNYGYGYEQHVTFIEIDSYLSSNRTVTFLSNFRNDIHRDTIRQQLRYCPFIDLCSFSLNLVNSKEAIDSCCSPCACDYPSCLTYQTCCPDILPSSMFYVDEINITGNDKKYFDDYIRNDNMLTCTLLHAKRIYAKHQKSAYTYAMCPTETDANMINLCTRTYTINISKVEDMLPVTTTMDLITYRNKYCAFCNGIPENELEFWTLHLSCEKNMYSAFMQSERSLLDFIFSSDICDLAFGEHLYNQTRKCKSSISACNETGLWKAHDYSLMLRCSLYISDIRVYSESYRNLFCLQCNGYEPKLPSKFCHEMKPGGQFDGRFSFSGLIKLSSLREGDVTSEKYEAPNCTQSQVYDNTTNECRTMFCSALYILQEQMCVRMFESVRSTIYTVYLRIFPADAITIHTAHLLMEDVLGYLQMHILNSPDYFPNISISICSEQIIYMVNVSYFEKNSVGDVAGSNLLSMDTRFELTVIGYHDPYRVADALNKLGNLAILINSELIGEVNFILSVIDDSIGHLYDIVKVLSEMERYNNLSFPTEYRIPLTELIRYSASDGNKNTIIPYFRMNTRYKCLVSMERLQAMSVRDCPAVELSITNSSLVYVDREHVLSYKGFLFKSSQFSFKNNHTIMLCVEEYKRYLNQASTKLPRTFHLDNIEITLSIVGVSFSIGSLTITLITFSLYSSLRTFPGLNTLSLCSFLLIANCVYLIGSFAGIKHSILCKTMGVTLHFSWLSALFWMNICTFHMFRVLTHTRPRTAINWGLFALYHTYAFLSSCICIAVNIGLSLYHSGNTDIGYGEGICYISSESMKAYTFGIPVLLVVLSNICMFSAVVISVKRKSSIHKTSSNERNDLLIFVKLSSLTGSTWLFGFIYYWTDLRVFSYVFTILNSSQGIFMMLSFVINQRIFNLYKTTIQKFTKIPGSDTGTYNLTSKEMNRNTTKEHKKNRKCKYISADDNNVRDTRV